MRPRKKVPLGIRGKSLQIRIMLTFFSLKKTKKKRQTHKTSQQQQIHGFVVTRYAVTRFTKNP